MRIDVDFSEVARLANDMATDAAVASGAVERGVGRATDWLYDRAKSDAPVASGDLVGSIRKDPSGLARRVYSLEKQGFFQEYGTSRHPPQAWLMIHSEAAHGQLESEIAKARWGLSA